MFSKPLNNAMVANNGPLPLPGVTPSGKAEYDPATGKYSVDLTLNFKFENKEAKAGQEYVFNYPAGVIIPEGLLGEHQLRDNSKNIAGSYIFVKNEDDTYSVKVIFDEEYIKKAGDTVEGHVSFSGTLDAKADENGDIKFPIGESGVEIKIPSESITYPGDKTDRYDISSSKSGSYIKNGNKLEYTVIVRSILGTPDPIKFTDEITVRNDGTLILGQPSNVKVEQGTYKYYPQWGGQTFDNNDWTQVSNVKVDCQGNKINIDNLGKLEPGVEKFDENNFSYRECNYYRITYTYDLGNQEITNLSAHNKASAEATSNKDGQTVTTTVTKDINIDYSFVMRKDGWIDNEKDGKIHWKITVNDNRCDITNSTLTDDWLSQISQGTNITVSPNEGFIIETGADGKKKITFTQINGAPNNNYYTIEYYTDPPASGWDSQTVKNIAKFDPTPDNPEDPTIDSEKNVDIAGAGGVTKTCKGMTISGDGSKGIFTWKVVIDVPAGGLPANTAISDTFGDNNHWLSRDQINNWALNLKWAKHGSVINPYVSPEKDILFLTSDGGTYSFKDISGNTDGAFDNLTFKAFTIKFPKGLRTPNGEPDQLVFEYSTTADLSAVNGSTATFKNNVDVGGKKGSAEYTYRKDSVVKTDGNNQTNDTSCSSSDGNLTWKVKVSISEGKNYKDLTVTDTLPDGIVLDKVSLSGETSMNLSIDENGNISGNNENYSINGKYDAETGIVSLRMVNKDETKTIKSNAEYVFTYECHADSGKLGEFVPGQKYPFTNSVTVKTGNTELGSDHQKQEWTYIQPTDNKKVLTKAGSWDNNSRLINYSIIINPEGKDLVEGKDTLELTDTMGYSSEFGYDYDGHHTATMNASLVQSSVKLYEAVVDSNGDLQKKKEIKDWKWTYSTTKPDLNSKDINNIISATGVPDSTPLIMEYSYSVSSTIPDKHVASLPVWNNAKLEGTNEQAQDSGGGKQWEEQKTSGGVASDNSYTFNKVEKGNYSNSLPGAVFSVYEFDPQTGKYAENACKTYTTDEYGIFHIRWKENGTECGYKTNTLYKVMETKAPKNYKKPRKVEEFYFYFSSETDTEHQLPENIPTSAVDLSRSEHTVYVENVRDSTNLVIKKIWKNKDGVEVSHDSGEIVLDVYQKFSVAGGSSEGACISYKLGSQYDMSIVYSNGTIDNAAIGSTIEYSIVSPNVDQYNKYPIVLNQGMQLIQEEWNLETKTYTAQATVTGDELFFGIRTDYLDPNTFSVECIGSPVPEPGPSTENDQWMQTIKLSPGNNWRAETEEFPLTGKAEDGSTVYYYYYVKEKETTNYVTTYENNGGITSGIITVTNTEKNTPAHELPETGGPGTRPYTLGGLLTLFAGCLLLYRNKKRGKEDFASS